MLLALKIKLIGNNTAIATLAILDMFIIIIYSCTELKPIIYIIIKCNAQIM